MRARPRDHGGIIPAYAGNTPQPFKRTLCCGGSSPHTRGTPSGGFGAWNTCGIIPAYAGNTRVDMQVVVEVEGSSPHTRGTPGDEFDCHIYLRDHPRIRGEHDLRRHGGGRGHGIIPAYAGNTRHAWHLWRTAEGSSPHTRGTRPTTCAKTASRRDHPRIRGEHIGVRDQCRHPGGIIPAYAGNTPLMSLVPITGPGIIPAYAGNTFLAAGAGRSEAGSSPHTRGTRVLPAAALNFR